jgi:hypothetical protein
MPTNQYTPIILPVTVTPGGVFADFSAIAQLSAVSMSLVSATDSVFFAFDAMPPAAALSAGVGNLNSVTPAVNLEDISFSKIGLKVAAGSAVLQIIGLVRSGSTGGGGFNG